MNISDRYLPLLRNYSEASPKAKHAVCQKLKKEFIGNPLASISNEANKMREMPLSASGISPMDYQWLMAIRNGHAEPPCHFDNHWDLITAIDIILILSNGSKRWKI